MEQIIRISVDAAESSSINPDNLECFWYAPWNAILVSLLQPPLLVNPQLSLQYSATSRDNVKIPKVVIPDFVVTHYKKEIQGLYECKYLIVEIKRAADTASLEDELDAVYEQLKGYVRTVFLDKDYYGIFGIVSVGRGWKWYRFVRQNTLKGHKPKTSWGSKSYIPSDEEEEEVFEIAYKSKTLDIMDKSSFDFLINEMKGYFSN
jgi:hypothetical protein